MPPIRPIVLSTSALASAIGAMAQLVEQNPGARLALHDLTETLTGAEKEATQAHTESMRGAVSGVAAEMAIRQHMGAVLPALDLDTETMRESWVRLATFDNIMRPQTGADNQGMPGLLRGHHADSTFDGEAVAADSCYSNCHSACHGSRGWR